MDESKLDKTRCLFKLAWYFVYRIAVVFFKIELSTMHDTVYCLSSKVLSGNCFQRFLKCVTLKSSIGRRTDHPKSLQMTVKQFSFITEYMPGGNNLQSNEMADELERKIQSFPPEYDNSPTVSSL